MLIDIIVRMGEQNMEQLTMLTSDVYKGVELRLTQVWFQNRRSKDRRMKQLSALGIRRQFFRSPHRLRSMHPGNDLLDLAHEIPGYGYFQGTLLDFYWG